MNPTPLTKEKMTEPLVIGWKTKSRYIPESDVASAVVWLKKRLDNDLISNDLRQLLKIQIDKAFAGVTE